MPVIGWLTCLALVASTGARLATAILLVVPVLHPRFKGRLARVVAIAAVAGLGLAIFYTSTFQQRFFHSGTGTLSQLVEGDIRDSGRFAAWDQVWEAAREQPILGAGVGSAYRFVPTVWTGMNHVHNEYLRVVFEFGFVGLAIFVGVLLWQYGDLRRRITRSEGVTRCAFVASLLGLYVLVIASITGNVISTNLLFMNPLFALMGAAYGVAGHRYTEDGEKFFQEKEAGPWPR
jgi:O-antigen ligase